MLLLHNLRPSWGRKIFFCMPVSLSRRMFTRKNGDDIIFFLAPQKNVLVPFFVCYDWKIRELSRLYVSSSPWRGGVSMWENQGGGNVSPHFWKILTRRQKKWISATIVTAGIFRFVADVWKKAIDLSDSFFSLSEQFFFPHDFWSMIRTFLSHFKVSRIQFNAVSNGQSLIECEISLADRNRYFAGASARVNCLHHAWCAFLVANNSASLSFFSNKILCASIYTVP